MQSNQITLGTTAYERYQEYPDRSVYIHPDHTIGSNRLFSLSRVVPSSEGATARVRAKFVREIVQPVTGVKGSIYTTVEASQPVWADDADTAAQAADLALFMSGDEFQSLLHKQSI